MNWLDTQPLNQLASTWRDVTLGRCEPTVDPAGKRSGGHTIGSSGCLITCFAMLARAIPPAINRIMLDKGLFHAGCLAATFDVQSIGFQEAPALVGLTTPHIYDPFPASDLRQVWTHVRTGYTALLCIDSNPRSPEWNQHWVQAVAALGVPESRMDFVVNDPYGGEQTTLLTKYGTPFGAALSRILVRAVLYAEGPSTARARSVYMYPAPTVIDTVQLSPAVLPQSALAQLETS